MPPRTRKTAVPTEQELRDAATGSDAIKGEVISTVNVSPHNIDWTQEPIERVLIEARKRIGAVSKTETNKHFGFQYRGIDQIIDRVVPVFNQLGVLMTPIVKELSARGGNAIVWVDYVFHGPAGDQLIVPMVGEQSDTTKALSIAWRTCLIQALNLPTDQPDPDAGEPANVTAHHAPPASRRDEITEAQIYVQEKWLASGRDWDFDVVTKMFWESTNFQTQIGDASAVQLREFADGLTPHVDDYSEGTKR